MIDNIASIDQTGCDPRHPYPLRFLALVRFKFNSKNNNYAFHRKKVYCLYRKTPIRTRIVPINAVYSLCKINRIPLDMLVG